MGRFRNGRRVAIAVTLVALVVPGSASSQGAAGPPGAGDEAVLERLRALAPVHSVHLEANARRPERRTVRPADVLLASGDPRTPAAWAKAARTMTERVWDIKLPDPREQLLRMSKQESRGGEVEEAEGNILRYGLPGGDLSGDGLEDAISIDLDTDAFVVSSLSGIRGTDGAELWSLPITPVYDAWAVPVGDMNSDGSDDLLLSSLDVRAEGVGTCTPLIFACAFAEATELSWGYTILSGADGSTIWDRTFDGSSQEAIVLTVGILHGVQATDAFVLAVPSGDHDGDGVNDLVFNRFDVRGLYAYASAGTLVAGASVEAPLLSVNTTGLILSGADGETLFERSDGYRSGGNLLLPSGDAVGDGTTDLRWETIDETAAPTVCAFVLLGTCLGSSDTSLSVEMIDGDSLAAVWTETLDEDRATYTFVDSARADLDGDGKQDLIVDDWWDQETSIVSGFSGQTAWTATEVGYPVAIGSIGGTGGEDVLTVDVHWEFDDETFEETLDVFFVRSDGATGDELFRTSHRFSSADGWFDIISYITGDSDADGTDDVAIDSFTIDPETFEIARSRVVVESGATGGHLFVRDVAEVRVGLPAGDIDAAGGDDLLDVAVALADDVTELRFDAVALPSGTPLWSRTDRFQDGWDLLLIATGDQVGDGGDDAIYDRLHYARGVLTSRVDGIDGRTGSFAWGYGPPLPEITPRAVISGRVTNEDGDPIRYVCVDVLDPVTGFLTAYDYTAADGTYRITGLPAGDHKVRFEDCDEGIYGAEFFDDQQSFDDADIVTTIGGSETSGIDAILAGGSTRPPVDPPPNDAFSSAEPITQRPFSVTSSTDGATTEAGEPRPCGFIGSTVWYAVTPPAPGPMAITTIGSDYDTVLAVYHGDSFGSLEPLGCNDDFGGSLQSAVIFVAEPDATYYVQVGGFAGDTGSLVLNGL